MNPLAKMAAFFSGSRNDNDTAPKWYVQAFRSKPMMYGLVIAGAIGVIYFLGSQSAKKKLKLDQVDTDKLPSNEDKMENISKQELTEIVGQCRWLFDNVSAVPGIIVAKNALFKRLLTLSEYELGLVNNQYNHNYAEEDDNLYREISDDYWYTYDDDLQGQVLSRLRGIGAGKSKSN